MLYYSTITFCAVSSLLLTVQSKLFSIDSEQFTLPELQLLVVVASYTVLTLAFFWDQLKNQVICTYM